MMMKTMMLLAIAAVCISAAPAGVTNRHVLMSIYDALNDTMKHLPEKVFLHNLRVEGHLACTSEFFCQTLKELGTLSGLSGPKYEPFRTDKELIRNLNVFNSRHHNTTCPVADNSNSIELYGFLTDLKKCLQMKIRNKK
ncbi:hypothetical protein E1301_Tti015878 [Triplophysa tibetana]|uniref:Interleukin-4 n=1 Tax=Triplophysa tibetana TaxID=1572043 RepID=A0A5A9PEH6_9TELE|nr:hypothetical protein E1301_Tti015878 [Triplophysa tibetana]